MRYRLYGGKVLRRYDDKYHLIKEDIFCEDGRITKFDPSIEYISIDMAGKCIIPAFFNMHSHLGESLYYDFVSGEDWNLQKYLTYTEKVNSAMDKAAKDEFWFKSARLTAKCMMEEGTAGFCAARAGGIAKEYGLFAMSGYPIMNNAKLVKFKNGGIEMFRVFYDEQSSGSCSVGVFLHSVYANDEESFDLAMKCMKSGAEYLTVHVSEDYETHLLEKQKHGMSAIKTLDGYGLLNEKSILVHCGYCTEDDLNLISERKAVICVCPISNRFLHTRMPDLYKLEEKNIPWCITTDGLSTGRTFSLLEQINEAKRVFPLIPDNRFMDSITNIPGSLFQRIQYSGMLEEGVVSIVNVVEDDSDEFEELFDKLLLGNVKYKMRLF